MYNKLEAYKELAYIISPLIEVFIREQVSDSIMFRQPVRGEHSCFRMFNVDSIPKILTVILTLSLIHFEKQQNGQTELINTI